MDYLEWIRTLELSEWYDEETDSIVTPSEVSSLSDDGEDSLASPVKKFDISICSGKRP